LAQTYEDDNHKDKDKDEGPDADISPAMKEMQNKWKDEYAKIGDVELSKIIEVADSITETEPYKLTKEVQAFWKPISNRVDKEYRTKRRMWESHARAISKMKEPSDDEQSKLEDEVDNYYSGLLQEFFDLDRKQYDDLPPAVTSLAVEAALHHLKHPLSPKAQASKHGLSPELTSPGQTTKNSG
jgi:hypothetical protein